jgi:uncharacterized protein (TIGR03086 family)
MGGMTNAEIAGRYRKVADAFTARVHGVAADGWDAPAPCEGWVARDIVRHLTSWMPGYLLGSVGVDVPAIPSVDDDPVGAWDTMNAALQAAVDDPDIASRPVDMQGAKAPFAEAVSAFGIGDVLVHTWDLARATGQDETLDIDEVRRLMESSAAMDEVMRGEHFGPKVAVPDDADEQTKLIAFTGRTP